METPTPAAPETTITVDAPATGAVEQPGVAFHEMTPAERSEFLKSGKSAKRESTDGTTADSSTAPAEGEKAAETAATDGKAASEPAAPAKDKKARNSEENRVAELLEDRKRERDRAEREARRADALERELVELRKPKPDATADSSTTADPSQPEWKKYRNLPGAPKIEDFSGEGGLEDFIEAKALFIAKQIAREEATGIVTARETQQQEYAAAQREMETVVNQAAERLKAEETTFPDLTGKVDPRLKALTPARFLPEGQSVGPHHYAKDLMTFESEHPLHLHAFYSSEEGQAEWKAMMSMPPRHIERTILARDLSFRPSSQVTPEAGKPAPKTFTKTPPPPDKGGQKTAAVVNKADAAVKAGNFKDFMAAMDEAAR